MEITQDQFTANLQQMPQEAQVQVIQIIENNEPPALQAFAASLGVTLSTGEEQPMMPGERNLQEMQEFENRTDPDPDPDPDLSDPMANVGQVTAPEAQPAASPMQGQMQQLALGTQVTGKINQPGAENETGIADDVPMKAREGSFFLNKVSVGMVGRKDLEERILEPAIKFLKERDGIEIKLADIIRPAQQVEGDQDVLVSNKEYYIPPELAEVIGTDLLEKINNRGKPDTEKKLEEQEQQPQQKQEVPVRAAKGLQVDKKKVDPKEEAKRKLRIKENDRLEKGKDTTSLAKKLFQKENFLTIGFGHRVVPRESAKLFQDLFGVTAKQANSIALGKTAITRDQALKLFDRDYKVKEDDVIRRVGGEKVYKNLPTEIQGVFVDANFRGDFQKNNKNYKWVQNTLDGDYAAASAEVIDHDEFRDNPKSGIAKRLQEYSNVLASFAVNSPPEGRTPLALEKAPPAQETQTDDFRVSPESVNRSFMAESPDQDPRLRTQMQPPANQRPCQTNPTAATPLRPRKEEK